MINKIRFTENIPNLAGRLQKGSEYLLKDAAKRPRVIYLGDVRTPRGGLHLFFNEGIDATFGNFLVLHYLPQRNTVITEGEISLSPGIMEDRDCWVRSFIVYEQGYPPQPRDAYIHTRALIDEARTSEK